MERKAERMFNQLGYSRFLQSQEVNGKITIIGIIYKSLTHTILFLNGMQTYAKCSIDPDNLDEDISMEEHIAIHQQLLELGWIK